MSSPHGAGGILSSPTSSLSFAPAPSSDMDSQHSHHDLHLHDPDMDSSYDVLPPHLADDDDLNTQSGKKRKVPVPLVPGSEADADTGRDGADRNPPRSAREDTDAPAGASGFTVLRPVRSPGARLAAQRRALFHKRKAGLVALYLDAQGAVDSTATHLAAARNGGAPATAGANGGAAVTPPANAARPSLPDVSTFERLLPALEDVGVWAPDAPGWRDGDDAAMPVPRRSLERWRTAFATRKRVRLERVPVARGGWAPEGSFELDVPTDASTRARARARERTALARLAEQLRALVLAANKLPTAPDASPNSTPPPSLPPVVEPPAAAPPVVAGGAKKNKKKKKKRTTLANEGNPHHVDKYRPSRPVPVADPYEPWPHHATLLFPPSMRILAARPGGKDVRPGEDEYICSSCQYALTYGSEALRRQAIKQRKAELARREKLRARAYDATHGGSHMVRRHSHDGGHGHEDDDDEDYEDEDDDGCGDEDDDGAGRCTCGRALRKPHIDEEAEPPDKPG